MIVAVFAADFARMSVHLGRDQLRAQLVADGLEQETRRGGEDQVVTSFLPQIPVADALFVLPPEIGDRLVDIPHLRQEGEKLLL